MSSPHTEAVQHAVETMSKVLEGGLGADVEGAFQDSLVAVAAGPGAVSGVLPREVDATSG